MRQRKQQAKMPKEQSYRTTWQLTFDLLCKLQEIDEDAAKGGRWQPILHKQCQAIEVELNARDGF